mgnify:FL=1
MYKKILFTSCACVGILLVWGQVFSAWSCAIQNGPIAELAEYTRWVDKKILEIKNDAGSNSCGITKTGATSAGERTLETIDKAFLETPIFDNTFLDFQYNIKIAINGETRAPVSRDGTLFVQTEKKITGAISNMANSCSLTDGFKEQFKKLLQENQALENIFKQAALGVPADPTGLSEENLKIAQAINANYNPTATDGCKDMNGLEEGMEKIMKWIEKIWKKNEGVLTDWKKAIAMFQWGGSKETIQEKIEKKRKQLQSQLSNLGQSIRMSDRIVKNFDCFQSKTMWDDSVANAVKAKLQCMANPILWLENVLLPFKKKVTKARTTDERVYYVNKLVKEDTVKKSVIAMDSLLRTRRAPEIETRSTLMLDLIDLHISLLFTAEAVEKRLPKMAKNCMKWQVSVACPTP